MWRAPTDGIVLCLLIRKDGDPRKWGFLGTLLMERRAELRDGGRSPKRARDDRPEDAVRPPPVKRLA